MRTAPVLILLTLAGCDGGAPGYAEEEARLTHVEVRYEVRATYASCTVARNTAQRQPEQVTLTTFPWTETLTVATSAATPFVASIVATCTDDAKAGKSGVFIFAADTLAASGSTAGFGASSRATFAVTPPSN